MNDEPRTIERTYYDDIQALTNAIELLTDIGADPMHREFREYAPEAARKAGRLPLNDDERAVLETGWTVMERHGWTAVGRWPRGGLLKAREGLEAEEIDAATEYHAMGEAAMNPGVDWITEATGELGVDSRDFDNIAEDEGKLWDYRVWATACALRREDEAEYERQTDR
ncbi:MAG: hypothetical protein OXQ31_14335 [Spirochaetaceae bacterium]|nr:hypothetical protein [Spirochaetaceae bacterium]